MRTPVTSLSKIKLRVWSKTVQDKAAGVFCTARRSLTCSSAWIKAASRSLGSGGRHGLKDISRMIRWIGVMVSGTRLDFSRVRIHAVDAGCEQVSSSANGREV